MHFTRDLGTLNSLYHPTKFVYGDNLFIVFHSEVPLIIDYFQSILITLGWPNVVPSIADFVTAAYNIVLHQRIALAVITQLWTFNSSVGSC